MHKALLKLMRLQFKGWVRRQLIGGTTPPLIFGILSGIFILIWLASVAISAAFQEPMAPDRIMATLPLYITAFALLPIIMGSDDRAIAFSPAEIDFLFAGPFSRRDLVLFKMIKLVLGSLGGGVFFALMLRRFAGSLPVCIAGAAMTLVFTNLLSTMAALLRDTVREKAYALVRWGAAIALLLGGAAIAWYVQQSDAPIWERLKDLGNSTAAQILLAPARVFAHVFAAQTFGEFVLWSAACLAMIGALTLAILALDKAYMGAALAASQRRQARIARLTRGISGATGKPARAIPLPDMAALGPIGAILKRQFITALRTSRGWMIAFVIAVGYAGFVMRFVSKHNDASAFAGLTPGLFMLVMILPQALRFDFRGDLDHMDTLKALPMSPSAAVLGELAVPTLILCLLGWIVTAGATVFVGLAPGTAVMLAMAMVPVAAALIGLENFVFLIFPTRLLVPGQGGAAFSGRRILMALARILLMGVGGTVIAGVGWGAWSVSGSIWATFLSCWLALLLVTAGVLRAVAWGFARFDVSVDMPT